MSLSLTCKNCGTELTADTEYELATLGQAHAQEHGHTAPMDRRHIITRIRRHNPKPAR